MIKKNIPEIGIGMLGCGFIGKLHCDALKRMPYIFWPPPAIPKLIKVCRTNKTKAKEDALRYGFIDYCTDWHQLINDERIKVFINAGPNNIHYEPCITAIKAGKHVICEKPLGINQKESLEMLKAVKKAGVKHLCNFNIRMFPALALAKELIEDGKIGNIYHYRANWLEDWFVNPFEVFTWRSSKEIAGSGAVSDLGSHMIDLARWFCGEPISVLSKTKTFINKRPKYNDSSISVKCDVDDAFISIIEYENGATGYLECSRVCTGRKEYTKIEINGEKGSISWNQEYSNNLFVYFNDDKKDTRGFHNISVSENFHPFMSKWWSPGLTIGFDSTFVHTVYNFLELVVNNKLLKPVIATFEDGYKASVIIDAILKSAFTEKKEVIKYKRIV